MPARARRRAAAALAPLLLSLAPLAPAAEVRDVRLWRAPDHTRLVFDLSEPAAYKRGALTAPRRVYVDLAGASLRADLSGLELANTPIRAIRHGIRNGRDLRIVMELAEEVRVNSFRLDASAGRGHRLVVDLHDLSPPVVGSPSVKKSVSTAARRDIVVAVDAGHGGEDYGAIGPGKLREKDVALDISREVARLFAEDEGFRAVLIRGGDYYIGLRERRELARGHQADLFVSIHADAFTKPEARGSSVYTLSLRGAASNNFARFLAERENASDLVGGVSLKDRDDEVAETLYDMLMTHNLDASPRIGARVLGEMSKISRLHQKRVGKAGFAVLKSPGIPSILVETGFISNPREARLLATGAYRRKMARAVHSGIRGWFHENPPADTLIAHLQAGGQREYTIVRGDTLSEIAQRHNVSLAALRSRNNLSGNLIRVGQKLIIPAS